MRIAPYVLGAVVLTAACAPKRIHEEPILENGDRVATPTAPVSSTAEMQARMAARRDSLAAVAMATCAPDVCEAIARGEIAIGMNSSQVLAATRTTEDAWSIRNAANATVFVPRSLAEAPADAVAPVAMVQLRDGRVSSYSYRERQGVRVVSSPAEATTDARAAELAGMLVREGDDLVAAGDLEGALHRYDRADVLRPGDPSVTYRIATLLDKQLRPIEALMRYQLFLHQMDLERIEARGDAYAKMADAIAHARERVIYLERHTR